MKNYKQDIIQFFMWMRNGISFCTTWFLILMLLYNYFSGIASIPTDNLIKLILWISGGVFIFCLLFSRLIIKKWHFVTRLSWFMLSICLYECLGFYWLDFFTNKGSLNQWLIFFGIILFLYLVCIAIYQRYSKKQGEFYTQALQNYQQKRSLKNES